MRWLRSARRVSCFFRPRLVELERRVVPGFLAARAYDAGTYPSSVAVGDFTGEGILDLAVANYTYPVGTVTVLLGNGDGSFQAQRTFAAGNGPASVAVGDFNGDGRLDLAVANLNSDDVSVLLGNGDGTFQAQRTFAAEDGPISVAVGDFTGEGILDLAVANYFSNNVSVLLGNGDGTFQAQRTFAAGNGPASVAVGDFNGDGHLDLALANYSYYGNSVSVLMGNGDGSFQAARTFAAGNTPRSVAVGDFNGDNHLDLAVADYVVTGRGTGVSVLLGNGDGSFQAPRSFAVGSKPISIAVGDFNGDGRLDLAVANLLDDTVGVLLGNGDGSFQASQTFAVGFNPLSVAVGDFNGDGYADLAVANISSNDVSILLNDRHWPRHQPPTRSPLPVAQPVAGGVGGVEPQALRHPAVVPEVPLAEAAFDLPPAAAGPVADSPPALPPPEIAQSESSTRPSAVPGPAEAARWMPVLPPSLAMPQPIRDLIFVPVLATSIDDNLVDLE